MNATRYSGGNAVPPTLGDIVEDPKRRLENRAFTETIAREIPGWLNEFTAVCATELLDAQADNALEGSLLEIGVYGGRFFAILAREALRSGSRLLGIDPFLHFSAEQVSEHLAAAGVSLAAESAEISLIEDVSGAWTADEILGALGGRARFVHIDGSHERAHVLWDLDLADRIIAPWGLIAIDDFLNPECLGVNEATHQFFQQQPRRSAPLAFTPGKLWLCGRLHTEMYKRRLVNLAMADETFPQAARFRRRWTAKRAEQLLFGSSIVWF
ncbi:MAG TPA: class I SAM-dependent methyltransferase [Caulobacteraceae bacterium]|nr:class I SAM-dependent methyltransferase [Caulobacteraceae bacterium]